MRGNRAPGQCWTLRKLVTGRYPYGYVRTQERDTIQVVYFYREDDGDAIIMSRSDARLLAKRLNECLDATVTR